MHLDACAVFGLSAQLIRKQRALAYLQRPRQRFLWLPVQHLEHLFRGAHGCSERCKDVPDALERPRQRLLVEHERDEVTPGHGARIDEVPAVQEHTRRCALHTIDSSLEVLYAIFKSPSDFVTAHMQRLCLNLYLNQNISRTITR